MGCHLTSAITRSSRELLSHVKNIAPPHTPPIAHPLQKQTEPVERIIAALMMASLFSRV